MGERKVLNKYIPPDFDPAKIPRGKSAKGGQIKVRIMLPMTICCNTCGEFIVKGTKFNARKEDVKGEDYLGMRIFRFYFRCTRCAAELSVDAGDGWSADGAPTGRAAAGPWKDCVSASTSPQSRSMPMQAILAQSSARAQAAHAAKRPLGGFPRVSQAAQDAAAVF